jgi:hypothetical protein
MAILYKALNFVLIVSIIFIIQSCSSSQEKSIVGFTVLASGANSGFKDKERIVVTDKANFQMMWDNLYINFSDKPPLPDVNFSNQMLIGVFLGEFPNGGSSIAVKSVDMYDDVVIMNIEELTPGPTCVTTDVITQPYQIVRIPKVSVPIRFVTIHNIRNCN